MEVTDFEKKLIGLINRQQLLQWENYALDKNNDLNKINQEIYSLIKEINYNKLFNKRKREVFINLSKRLRVENDPEIARLRNKLDNKDNYKKDLDFKANNQVKLAKRMRNDLIELLYLRNYKAQKQGFKSYPDLIFSAEELSKETIIKEVKSYLNKNLKSAKEIIKEYNLTWGNWFTKLGEQGSLDSSDPNYYIKCLFHSLDLDNIYHNINFKYKKDGISGMTFRTSPPEEIRILLKPVTSPMRSRVLLHECGHAINYIKNHRQGLYSLLTTSFDEIMAVLFEKIGINLCLTEEEREIALQVSLLENVRCSISFLFEMELWKDPENAEEKFIRHQKILPIITQKKELWVLDSFRYIDPVYIHNYVLGDIYAKKIINYLNDRYNDDYKKWSNIIIDHFLKDGLNKSFMDKYVELVK
ncbi:MAG: hypothetical protein K9K32_01775 [Halanaerobiales bacterium]|nr:hypothetical protein [Halanaerobiales bacterium]